MAKRDSKSGTTVNKAPKTTRHYTVGYTPNLGIKKPAPQLLIKGYWLEELGFLTGQPVTVNIEQGRLIIQVEGNV
ncbi:SymE family type I addiction module toxin [Serratia fonticola]|uniref:SymE family type I addiction module toxin n=1 Tax=Serratia fonticola TaxID=47917 RepID=UPI001AE72D7E|nr:SymE family type I addiction module toxin [Serratia fonticola]MBP0995701.1 type I toxin-antitoxin system SymE family toxin [Serratia fonticola]MBP0995708.1 type I toxin-antitoxin system SymE family toxin [Serratia fonticola]MBP1000874.1 type I toxin-antitoxin system SymE family toxin [Serratia fonticola]MBP1000881.1 type I toxin-antitoxin system SymE family toxin [Serratia fonticola]MBP1010562.1 type I toxin-antitoxin system SymE family toxin [Serratia fonticola]